MKTGIIGILYNPPRLDMTHPAGWNHIVRDILFPEAVFLTESDNWLEYDQLFICHGLNYKEGSYNVVGGVTELHIKRLQMLHDFNGKLYSFDDFDVLDFIKNRKVDFNWKKEWNYTKVYLPKKDNAVLGDSHSLSVWPNSSYDILRNDGKTLFGYLKDPLSLSMYKDIILYFGNIDIRFHLCRQPNPLKATVELFEKYINYAKKYNATLTHLLPIESEDRKLPKSGQYKEKNFFGTQEQRQTLVFIANDLMDKSGLKVIKWPDDWYKNLGYYEKEIMERTQSVHLKPRYYKKNITSEQVSLF
jgi:hypothetical protein